VTLYDTIEWICFACAALPAGLFLTNLRAYRSLNGLCSEGQEVVRRQVSVLIPARNEAEGICAAIYSVLESEAVELELIVLDDHSSDATARLVSEMEARDSRVRLIEAPPLAEGWCGKQHACWHLAHRASFPTMIFVDADVRLAPSGIARAVEFLRSTKSGLVSGFPQQHTATLLEVMLIPLVHFVLLSFLPLNRMRATTNPAYAAGCGQLMIADRDAYFASGGHSRIRATLHDGLNLPKVFRRAGFRTDLFDATNIASCRMYHSAREVWAGLGKNATEGLAHPSRIGPFTVLLLAGQVLPFVLLYFRPSPILWAAVGFCAIVRFSGVLRFRQSTTGAILHPFAVMTLLALQWHALIRRATGRSSTWRGRSYSTTGEINQDSG
jgi:glycosyltransferase involved in cell wall biosynthesis